jgi:hypothetical protein
MYRSIKCVRPGSHGRRRDTTKTSAGKTAVIKTDGNSATATSRTDGKEGGSYD